MLLVEYPINMKSIFLDFLLDVVIQLQEHEWDQVLRLQFILKVL